MSIKSVVEQRGVVFDTSGPNKHVHKIEVSIRVLKERVRSVIYSLPYVLPRKLIPTLVVFVTARLNAMPCKTRVDPTPPREIFTNMKISLNREIRVGFGGLVLVENVPNKKMISFDISIEPRARYQCHDIISSRYQFFLLDTEEFVVRTNWVENVPLTKALIDRINEIAARDEQLMVHNAEKGLGRKLAKLSNKPTPWSGSMEVKHGEALSTVVEDMSPTIIDRKSIPQIQVDDETAMTKRPAVQRVEELFMEQDQQDEGPDHRGPDASMHQTDQSSCRGADPHVEPVVAPDAPAEEFPDDTAAVDNENETSTDAEVNLGRERGILPARALGIHADGLEDAVSEDGDELAVPTQDNGAPPPPEYKDLWAEARPCLRERRDDDPRFPHRPPPCVETPWRQCEASRAERTQANGRKGSVVASFPPGSVLGRNEAGDTLVPLPEREVCGGRELRQAQSQTCRGWRWTRPILLPGPVIPNGCTELHLPGIGDCSVRREKHCHGHIGGAYLTAPMSSVVYMQLGKDVAAALVELAPKKYTKYLGMDGTLIVRLRKALYGCVESARLWFNTLSSALLDHGLESNPMTKCVLSKAMPKEKVQKGHFSPWQCMWTIY